MDNEELLTTEGVRQILATIAVAFPNFKPKDQGAVIALWSAMLCGFPKAAVNKAVYTYIMTDDSGFAPTIGQITSLIARPVDREELTELEAWSAVSVALKNGIYHAKEEYEKLPPLIQKAVGSPENLHDWAMMPTSEVHSIVQSNFMRSFRTARTRADERAKIPQVVRKRLDQLCGEKGVLSDSFNYSEIKYS